MLQEAIAHPYRMTLQQHANVCYAVSKITLHEVQRLRRQLADISLTVTKPVRIVLTGFSCTVDYVGLRTSTLEIPRSLVLEEDLEMLDRLSRLPFVNWEYYGHETYLTPMTAYSSAEEARSAGVTPDTERFLMMLGQYDMTTGPPAQGWQNLDVKDKWKEAAVASESVIASYTREDANCLRFRPDEEVWSGGALTYIIRVYYNEAPDDADDTPLFTTDGLLPAWVHSCS